MKIKTFYNENSTDNWLLLNTKDKDDKLSSKYVDISVFFLNLLVR